MYPHRLLGLLLGLPCAVLALDAPKVWRPFSADSPWNQSIPADPRIDPASRALMAEFAARGPLYINVRDWSIPVYFVDADRTPRHAVGDLRPGVYGAGFEFPRRIPIPADAVASPPVDGDNHLCIIDRGRNLEWGMWWARRDEHGGWQTGLGAVTDLSGTGVSAPWFDMERELDAARARASGFPLIAGLIRVEEIKAGRIAHALVFAYDRCRTGFFQPPASTAQATVPGTSYTTGIPMGGRIQLDPNWDVGKAGLSPSGRIIARALQEYGAFCGDYADGNVLFAENSPAAVAEWNGCLRAEELSAVFTPEMIRDHLRVLAMDNILPGQNCEIPPPYLTRFGLVGVNAAARIDFVHRTIAVTVPTGTDLRHLVATFSVFKRPTQVSIGAVEQVSGTTRCDFSSPVIYHLLAADGAVADWTVVVTLGR